MNEDIKQMIKSKGLRQWQVALQYGLSEGNFTKLLRYELSNEKRQRVLDAIEKASLSSQKDNATVVEEDNKNDKYRIGDELLSRSDGSTCVILFIDYEDDDYGYVLDGDGEVSNTNFLKHEKTGRYFPQISEIIKQLHKSNFFEDDD